ncbi:cyanase [Nocardia sp. NBC_00565]|uniref:cyanase n=1 Tax=Nocardia sp. NBC_00565 TaxID=2975993 RepID=UPI002E818896|nr:cyanase [Nocardia sp. NBC_00565]WUC05020.1 cyanase [Nocardia sp. NBC_00565]
MVAGRADGAGAAVRRGGRDRCPGLHRTRQGIRQHPLSVAQAEKAAGILELGPEEAAAFVAQPTRGALEAAVPTDPTIYRFYEVLQVYGPAIKELIHEKFGDGIMSAINFKIDVDRRDDPGGERVVVTLDGKYLKYQWG